MSLDAETLRQTIAAWGHAESETPPRYGDDLRADGINPRTASKDDLAWREFQAYAKLRHTSGSGGGFLCTIGTYFLAMAAPSKFQGHKKDGPLALRPGRWGGVFEIFYFREQSHLVADF